MTFVLVSKLPTVNRVNSVTSFWPVLLGTLLQRRRDWLSPFAATRQFSLSVQWPRGWLFWISLSHVGRVHKNDGYLNSFHGFWQRKLLRFHRFRGPTFSDMPKLSLEWPMDLVLWRFGCAVGRSQINGTVAETLNDCSLSGLPTEMIWDLSLYEQFSPSEPIRILGCELWMPICSTDDVSSYRFCWRDPVSDHHGCSLRWLYHTRVILPKLVTPGRSVRPFCDAGDGSKPRTHIRHLSEKCYKGPWDL